MLLFSTQIITLFSDQRFIYECLTKETPDFPDVGR
jgi:hypothetical protein